LKPEATAEAGGDRSPSSHAAGLAANQSIVLCRPNGAGAWGRMVRTPILATEKIAAILEARLGGKPADVGLVVGIVDADGRRIVCRGGAGRPDDEPLGGDTLFEIGSTTKAFTGLLLADMAGRGEVGLDDPVERFLPADVRLAQPGGRPITLEALATHTSGLPHDADNYAARDRANPFADYTVSRFYEFLRRWRPGDGAAGVHQYSNVGMGLLGHALALRAGVDFQTLVRTRIAEPLGMRSTVVDLPEPLAARLASGHDFDGRPTVHTAVPVIEGAGALRSTADDLLVFLAAESGLTATPLAAAMTAQLSARQATGRADFQFQALGWCVTTDPGGEVAWHVGRTTGFRAFLGLDRGRGVGVAVLGNQATAGAGEDIGLHLLTGRPLAPADTRHVVEIAPEALRACEGRYRLSPSVEITVKATNGRLLFRTGERRHLLYPESGTSFFMKQFDVQARFELDASGRATALVLTENGRERRAPRLGD
jgi:serine-type D-Ala-D-Ala carboxypeptidase/endopeptidase